MKEKILTREIIEKLGLDKVSVITADMLAGYTSIGDQAFCVCTGLTSVTIPNSVTSIGTVAFSGCIGLTSMTIPNSVTSIGDYAFYGCSGLTSVEIPNSVTSIGDYAFYGCTGLTSITIPSSVTSIGWYAFYYCIHLTSIEIPNSVTNIGDNAFENCASLTSVIISNNSISIGINAFGYCTSLASVTIGDKTYKLQTVTDNKCMAYKAFNSDMTCRGFQYKEGETYELDDKPILCIRGFHACLCLTDVFNYYCGKLGKGIHIHEVELEGISDERIRYESKVVAKKITIGKRIL